MELKRLPSAQLIALVVYLAIVLKPCEQILKLKVSIAARRAAGEEVFTDDEMDAAGLTAS